MLLYYGLTRKLVNIEQPWAQGCSMLKGLRINHLVVALKFKLLPLEVVKC